MVISPSPANRCTSSIDCTCCASIIDRNKKFTDSTVSLRKRRSARHCLRRHCSGMVCAEKMRKKKRKSRTNLQVSHEMVADRWKVCKDVNTILSENYRNDIHTFNNNVEAKQNVLNVAKENIQIILEQEEKENRFIQENEPSDLHVSEADLIAIEETRNIFTEEGTNLNTLYVEEPEAFNNCDAPQLSHRSCETKKTKETFLKLETDQASCQDIAETCILKTNYENRFSELINERNSECHEKSSMRRISTAFSVQQFIKDTDPSSPTPRCFSKIPKKLSQSGSSTTESRVTDNCIDSILYRELREKRFPSGQKSDTEQRQEADVIRCTPNDPPINDQESVLRLQVKYFTGGIETDTKIGRKNEIPVTRQQRSVTYKKSPNFLCENCCSDVRSEVTLRRPVSTVKKEFSTKLSSYFPQTRCKTRGTSSKHLKGDSVSEKSTDSGTDGQLNSHDKVRFSKCKWHASRARNNEEATSIIFENKNRHERSSVLRRSTNIDTCTSSVFSSSTTSTNNVDRSKRCNHTLSQFHRYEAHPRFTGTSVKRYNTKVDSTSKSSSSSNLSSSRRYNSWTNLSRDFDSGKRVSPFSSSCANIHEPCIITERPRRRCPRGATRTTSFSSPTSSSSSSSSSLMSPSTRCKSGSNSDRTTSDAFENQSGDRDIEFDDETNGIRAPRGRQTKRTWMIPGCRKQGEREDIFTDRRHVTWNITRKY